MIRYKCRAVYENRTYGSTGGAIKLDSIPLPYSAQRACGDQHSGHVHGHPHAAVFPAGDVREERPAAGKNTPQHDTGVFPAAPAAAL